MRKTTIKRLCALFLASMMALTACGNQSTNQEVKESNVPEQKETQEVKESTSETSETKEAVKEKATITLYPSNANLQSGTVSGLKGEFFAEHGLEVEVWAYSADKTNAILASGDLPDIIYASGTQLNTMIEADMLLPLDEYLDQLPNWEKYYEYLGTAENWMRGYASNGTGKVYGMPTNVGPAAKEAIPDTSGNAWKIRWDMYEGIGAPEIESVDQLLDVMAKMKETYPTDAEGNETFGTVLNAGTDSWQFKMMTQWYNMQGYENGNLAQPYLLEINMTNGEITSILEEDSMYYKGLSWFNEAYRRGLLDEGSINYDAATRAKMVDKGLVMVPTAAGNGYKPHYYPIYVPGTKVYYNPDLPFGTAGLICVNKNTTNLDACLEFLNLMIDPFTSFRLNFGPEGDAWYIDGDQIFMTPRMEAHLKKNNWSHQGYIFENGEEYKLFNTPFVLYTGVPLEYKDAEGNYRYRDLNYWIEFGAAQDSDENWQNWKKTTGYDNWIEWLEAEDALVTDGPMAGVASFVPGADADMLLVVNAVKDVVITASWKMVYAESEEEFKNIWDQMVADCEALGAKDLQDWRIEKIKEAQAIVESLKN